MIARGATVAPTTTVTLGTSWDRWGDVSFKGTSLNYGFLDGGTPITGLTASGITSDAINIVSGVTGAGYYQQAMGIYFCLNDVLQDTSWQSLYDYYKINGVMLEIEYQANAAITNSSVSAAQPLLTYAVDHDNASYPVSHAIVQAYQNARVHSFAANPVCRIDLVPQASEYVYDGGIAPTAVSSAKLAKPRQWFDTQNLNTQHYGLRMWWNQLPVGGNNGVTGTLPGAAGSFLFRLRYNISFKGTF